MKPDKPLPLPPEFTDVDTYVDSLLHFGTSCTLLRTLCGGIHINDFFNRDPDLYTQVLPQEWREYFKSVEIFELLDLLMREDLETFQTQRSERESESKESYEIGNGARSEPPQSLIRYIKDVRRHLLNRDFKPNTSNRKMDRKIAVGMNVKKVHEVENFSHYVDGLTSTINANSEHKITHLVDFGAGVNYLGRALASQPYNRNIIAIESRAHVVEGAKKMDVLAKISEKTVVMRNKKEWRKMEEAEALNGTSPAGKETPLKPSMSLGANASITPTDRDLVHKEKTKRTPDESSIQTIRAKLELPKNGQGTIQYVEHLIKKSNLEEVIDQIVSPPILSDPPTIPNSLSKAQEPGLMVISLHSCGNLLHHGIRTLTANPSVRAVALVGCCYNLMTERLNPPTYKIPFLREHPRLEKTSNIGDADGFPMSTRFLEYRHKILKPIQGTGGAYETPSSHTSPTTTSTTCCPDTDADADTPSPDDDHETGIRLNITARMMAVQAPQNWTPTDSSSFFTRHFYRALLQRLFLDNGILDPPPSHGTRPPGKTAPIIIGTLRKSCYASFVTYVRGVVGKLSQPQSQSSSLEGEQISETGRLLQQKINILTDAEIQDYVTRFAERKKELSVIWSLMAFSAGVVEAMVLVDRWTFLREQEGVVEAWVEPVFEYGLSPRNLVVVGIKG
ncbi:hypothetical protein BLS_004002 [Venturia inaequalis]|uniref:Methyltransferase domain-containing protein n=1 Tax=Venturia inaequalis TaxID=5025 RepID=A0A8H3V9M3_VENIN|nr:hypothetical protein BLS_004002 [Venturia inaequalis]